MLRALESINTRAIELSSDVGHSPIWALAQFITASATVESATGVICLSPSEISFLLFDSFRLFGDTCAEILKIFATLPDFRVVDEAFHFLRTAENVRRLHSLVVEEKHDLDYFTAFCFNTNKNSFMFHVIEEALSRDVFLSDLNGHSMVICANDSNEILIISPILGK